MLTPETRWDVGFSSGLCLPGDGLDLQIAVLHSPTKVHVLERPDWHGTPIALGEVFIVRKGRRTAECKLFTHQFGWELRLCIGRAADIVQSQVCRDQECVLSTGEQWKAAMLEKGWH